MPARELVKEGIPAGSVSAIVSWEELSTAPGEVLSGCDIALLNLIAAQGLPGTQDSKIPQYLAGRTTHFARRVE